jgi:Kef-type K+ transport system membrane component KefB
LAAKATRGGCGQDRSCQKITAVVLVLLPRLTRLFFGHFGGRPSELEAKYLLFVLLGLGALAACADSEAVLPAYLIGKALAGTVGKDHALILRLRTLTFGLLTPFYFIRAGSFVSVPQLIVAPLAFLLLLGAKMVTKVVGVYPVTRWFKSPNKEATYTTLLMSTGLTFGTISSLFGLSHGIIDQAQYSALVAAVVASAVIPTVIGNALFLPNHLLPNAGPDGSAEKMATKDKPSRLPAAM